MSQKINLEKQSDSQNHLNSGSCLCGKITFAVKAFLPLVGHCHCTMCQKFHGAAFSTFVEVKQQDLQWLSGEKLLTSYRAENNSVRKFCSCCGSSLVFESTFNRTENTLEISLAAFDRFAQDYSSNEIIPSPDAHLYVASKVKWLTINDGLPQFKAYRDNN